MQAETVNLVANGTIVQLEYSSSATSSKLVVEQACDENAASPTTNNQLTTTSYGWFTTQTSSQACPIFTLNAFFVFVEDYKWVFGGIFLLIGIFLNFFGKKLFTATVFIASTVFVCFFIMIIFYTTFLKDTQADWVGWIVVGFSVIFGLLAGYFAAKMEKLGGMLLCGWGGWCLGILLNETVLYLAGQSWLYWTVNSGLALIGAFLGYVIFVQAVIFATSFIGAYLSMRAFGIWFGGFPNEIVLQN